MGAAATAVALTAGVLTATSASAYARPGVTTRLDVGLHGAQATADPGTLGCTTTACGSGAAIISGNGRDVAFISFASNLVSGDRNHGPDVFVRDLTSGRISMATVSSTGVQQTWANPLDTMSPADIALSSNGRYVAFVSAAPNLVPGDTNAARDVFVHDLSSGVTTRVDVSSSGAQAGQGVGNGLSMSADGRMIAFASASPDVVAGDTNGVSDVFVHDMKTGKTQRVSLSSSGAQGDGAAALGFSLSPTGRFVAFASSAGNLVDGDTNNQTDVFLRDMQRNTTEMISVRPDGSPVPALGGNSSAAYGPGSAISADGRFVLFDSNSMLLIPNDTNRGNGDMFVRDRLTHRTERVSVASDGTDRQVGSGNDASITPDGRFVVYRTGENLDPDDQGTCPPAGFGTSQSDNDIYLYDRRSGAAELLTRATNGAHAYASAVDSSAGCQASEFGSISSDARKVVFVSSATNLTKGDTNRSYDTFLRERGPDQGVGGFAASAPSTGPPAPPTACIEGQCVPLCVQDVCLPGNAALEAARVVVRPVLRDVFVDLQLPSTTPLGAAGPAPLYGLDFTVAGNRFELRMQRQPSADGGGDFRLFRQQPAGGWTFLTAVRGGYGTTGADVVAAVPLAALGRFALGRSALGGSGGSSLTSAEAFVASGSVVTGPLRMYQQLPLRGEARV
jgi:Tol biopolymer transport system component